MKPTKQEQIDNEISYAVKRLCDDEIIRIDNYGTDTKRNM